MKPHRTPPPAIKTAESISPSIPMGGIAVAGGITVAGDQHKLRMLVGSCIGLALYERRCKLGGMAHIVLPRANGVVELAGKFADTAAPALIEQLAARASRRDLQLVGKIAGGANMFGASATSNPIGVENQRAIERILDELRIPIVGRHLGGERGRRLTFDPSSGALVIEIAGEPPVSI